MTVNSLRTLFLFLAITNTVPAFAQLIPRDEFTQYTVEDGLPSNFAYAVEQDDRGYIWIATDAGLSRFDGYEFKNYTLADGLPDTEIINFYKDSLGRIWLYTLNGNPGYIYEDSIFTIANKKLPKELKTNGIIRSIIELDSIIYISGSEHLKLFKDGSASRIPVKRNQSIFLSTRTGEKAVYGLFEHCFRITNGKVNTIGPTGLGFSHLSHWVNSSNLFIAHKGRTDSLLFFNPDSGNHFFKKIDGNAIGLNLLKTQREILYTTKNGVFRLDSLDYEAQKLNDLPDISNALKDNQGNYWLSSLSSGLFLLPTRKINRNRKFDTAHKLEVIEDNQILLHHDEIQLSIKEKQDTFQDYLSLPTLQGYGLTKALKVEQNLIIASTNGVHIRGINTLYDIGNMRDIVIDIPYIYYGLYDQRIIKTSIKAFSENLNRNHRPFPVEKDSPKNLDALFRKMTKTKDTIWIATENGLYFNPKDQPLSPQAFETSIGRIWDMEIESANSMFLATGGNGVIIKSQNGNIQIDKEDGMLSDICQHIEKKDSILWVATSKGLNQIILKKNGDHRIYAITKKDGLPSNKINDIAIFDDTLYVATAGGLGYFHANTSFADSHHFPIYVTSLSRNDSISCNFHHPELPHDSEIIRVSFTAINYTHHDRLSYSYRLVENNNASKWVATSNLEATFINLKHGEYQFEVRAKTNNSTWTEAAILPFTITPPFWSTLWFQFLLISTSVFIGYLGYQQITRSKRIRAQLAADRIEAQLQALRAQINPHFLFNALNSIKRFILKNENDAAEAYLTKYSHHIRDILHFSRKLTLSIHQEVTLIERYVEIEKIRTGESFLFKVEIDSHIDPFTTFIPTMVIQPFVENAIWHGILQENAGEISLYFNRIADKIEIKLVDNGVGFDRSMQEDSNSLGISLVRERIRLIGVHYNSKTNLEVLSRPGEGTEIRILIPADLV